MKSWASILTLWLDFEEGPGLRLEPRIEVCPQSYDRLNRHYHNTIYAPAANCLISRVVLKLNTTGAIIQEHRFDNDNPII